jgi:phosphomannomutase
VEDIAARYDATVLRTPVGEINVAQAMLRSGAVIGGEGSGGVILPSVHPGRDAMVGIGLVLQMLADRGGTLSELKSTLPAYAIAKGSITLATLSPHHVLDRLRERYAASARVNTDDGLRLDFPDHWVHMRKSNTEPIVRIFAEAESPERAEALVLKYRREIERDS